MYNIYNIYVIYNHINFRPIHFALYGNIKVKQRFDICFFQV